MNIPLLFLSDSPCLKTGLARITRDLATICASMPEFKVATLGRGGIGSSSLPWQQYNFPESSQWGENELPQVWANFARNQPGIIFTVWDASRLSWFAQPQFLPDGPIKQFLSRPNFQRWGYFMQDGSGVSPDRLPGATAAVMAQYNRTLLTSHWGNQLAQKSNLQTDWLPHGINEKLFYPRPKIDARAGFGLEPDGLVLGMCATNQARKDFPVGFETAARLKKEFGKEFTFWLHTDIAIRYWNVYALVEEYGLSDNFKLSFTGGFDDTAMAMFYSACDLTMLPSAGEGFGYPIVESQMCGVRCLVPNYSAACEVAGIEEQIPCIGTRIDTAHNVRRALLCGKEWGERALEAIVKASADNEADRLEVASKVEHLKWSNLKPLWVRWLLAGLGK